MIDLSIGTIFCIDGIKLKVVEAIDDNYSMCEFDGKSMYGNNSVLEICNALSCMDCCRTDNKSVRFITNK